MERQDMVAWLIIVLVVALGVFAAVQIGGAHV